MIHMFVPIKMIPPSKKYSARQYPKAVRKLMIKKRAIWRTMKMKHSPELKSKYSVITNECNLAIQKFDTDREKKLLESNNLGTFYKFINNKLSNKTGIETLKSASGEILCSDHEKANLLNEYFRSFFSVDNGSIPPFPSRLPPYATLKTDVNVQCKNIIAKLKTYSSAGPDRITPIFYKRTVTCIAFPLSVLFRTFFELNILPDEWKLSIVPTIFKKARHQTPKTIAL